MKTSEGFTLIELLVVIAIISLLVSILLPSLRKAQDLAKSAVCMSNMKNIGLTLGYYTQDNSNVLPNYYFTNNLGTQTWYTALSPYTDDGNTGMGSIFVCPEVNATANGWGGAPSYVWNARVATFQNLDDIAASSRFIVSDGDAWWYFISHTAPATLGHLGWVHLGSNNFLFADFSVRSIHRDEFNWRRDYGEEIVGSDIGFCDPPYAP